MNEFKSYHPVVNFVYFTAVIGFTMFFMNPVFLAVSFCFGFLYSAMLGGGKTLRFNLTVLLPFAAVAAIVNALINHEGITIVCYLPSGNPLTLESVAYGTAAAVMLISVICCFSCFNNVITSDKLMFLLGKASPTLSLMFSMSLRFVPGFKTQLDEIEAAQRGVFGSCGFGAFQKVKNSIKVFSILITKSLENAVETADSMKSRGYGLSGRTSYSNFCLSRRDKIALFIILALASYVFAGWICGGMYFRFFPSIKWANLTPYGISLAAAYLVLCGVPLIIEIWGALKWKKLKSKI